jgi:ribosomal protein L16/L10AE
LNLDYYIKKKHVFKKRLHTKYRYSPVYTKKKYSIYTYKSVRLDFVYIKLFRKLLRRKYVKARIKLFKPRYWLYLIPNYILTQKSKNSRMGAGVGKMVRLTNFKYCGKNIIKTWRYTFTYLLSLSKYLYFKIALRCFVR